MYGKTFIQMNNQIKMVKQTQKLNDFVFGNASKCMTQSSYYAISLQRPCPLPNIKVNRQTKYVNPVALQTIYGYYCEAKYKKHRIIIENYMGEMYNFNLI